MSDRERPVRVVLVDDHHFFRLGLRQLLADAGLEVVGEGSDGTEAAALVARLRPDVVLMDLRMPGLSGAEATKAVLERTPGVAVLALTGSLDDEDVLDAIAAGASGYLLKDAAVASIVDAVRMAADGSAVVSAEVARRLIDRVRDQVADQASQPGEPLTEREVEVLRLLAEGADNAEIARDLFISVNTVKVHVSRILDKLEARNRVEAAVHGVRAGLI